MVTVLPKGRLKHLCVNVEVPNTAYTVERWHATNHFTGVGLGLKINSDVVEMFSTGVADSQATGVTDEVTPVTTVTQKYEILPVLGKGFACDVAIPDGTQLLLLTLNADVMAAAIFIGTAIVEVEDGDIRQHQPAADYYGGNGVPAL